MQNDTPVNHSANTRITEWLNDVPVPGPNPTAVSSQIPLTKKVFGEPSRPVSPPNATSSLADAAARRGLNAPPPLDTTFRQGGTSAVPALKGLLSLGQSIPSEVAATEGVRAIEPPDYLRSPQEVPARDEYDEHHNLAPHGDEVYLAELREYNITEMQMSSNDSVHRDTLHWATKHGSNEREPDSILDPCGCGAGETIPAGDYYDPEDPEDYRTVEPNDASRGVNSDRFRNSDDEDAQIRPANPGVVASSIHPGSLMRELSDQVLEDRWLSLDPSELDELLNAPVEELQVAESRDSGAVPKPTVRLPPPPLPVEQTHGNPYSTSDHQIASENDSNPSWSQSSLAGRPQSTGPKPYSVPAQQPGHQTGQPARSISSLVSVDLGSPAIDLPAYAPPSTPALRPVESEELKSPISVLNLRGDFCAPTNSGEDGEEREPLMGDRPGEPEGIELANLDSRGRRSTYPSLPEGFVLPTRGSSRFREHLNEDPESDPEAALGNDTDRDLERNASRPRRSRRRRYWWIRAVDDTIVFLLFQYLLFALLATSAFVMGVLHMTQQHAAAESD